MKSSLSKSDAKDTILGMFKKTVRPVLIGQASLELRWPLNWVENLFDELVAEHKIRLCTKDELTRFDLKHGFLLNQ